MSCPCGDPSHDYDLLLTGAAKGFLANPVYYREVYKHWKDPTHHYGKSADFMAIINEKIELLKTGELSATV